MKRSKKDELLDMLFAVVCGIILGCFIAFADWSRFFL